MRIRSFILAILSFAALSSIQEQAFAQSAAKKAVPTASTVKALISANKNGGSALTQALIEAIKANPKLIDVILAAAANGSPDLIASISAAVSQAIVSIAQTNPQAAAELKQAVDAKAPDVVKKQVSENIANSTTATAAITGSNAGPLGNVGVPLSTTAPSSSVGSTSPQ